MKEFIGPAILFISPFIGGFIGWVAVPLLLYPYGDEVFSAGLFRWTAAVPVGVAVGLVLGFALGVEADRRIRARSR